MTRRTAIIPSPPALSARLDARRADRAPDEADRRRAVARAALQREHLARGEVADRAEARNGRARRRRPAARDRELVARVVREMGDDDRWFLLSF